MDYMRNVFRIQTKKACEGDQLEYMEVPNCDILTALLKPPSTSALVTKFKTDI
jgi:hypothetical protein